MTTDAAAQLAILADALTEIVDLATARRKELWRRRKKCWRGRGTSPPKLPPRPRLTGGCRRCGGRRDAGRRGEFRPAGVAVTAL